MEFLGFTLVAVGVCGLGLATFAIPMIASWLGSKRNPLRNRNIADSGIQTLSIWVAAHNEEKVISATLESLLAAIDFAKSSGVPLRFELGVALDHCADSTLDQIELFEKKHETPVLVLENPGIGAKWWNLKNIVTHVNSEWIAFVDAGSLWDEKLIDRAYKEMLSDVMAVAPSYSAKNSGLMERLNWKLEGYLKKFENNVGGPVSVHGASVIYRTALLKQTMNDLGSDHWLNDDVVIPLSLRLRLPDLRIVYLADHEKGWVSDVGVTSALDLEYRRRRRMVFGNIQWIQKVLFTRRGVASPMAFFLALRRTFRLFWAYSVLSIVLGVVLVSPWVGVVSIFIGLLGLTQSQFLRRVGMAFWSGLQVPKFWREFFLSKRGVTWS